MGTFTFVGVSPGAPEGTRRLLLHLAGLEQLLCERDRPSAAVRLEDRLGCELAHLLVAALTGATGAGRDVA